MVVAIKVDVLNSNVSFLIKLNLLDKNIIAVSNVHDVLERHSTDCKDFLARKNGLIYLEWQKERNLRYTYTDLKKASQNIFASFFQQAVQTIKTGPAVESRL